MKKWISAVALTLAFGAQAFATESLTLTPAQIIAAVQPLNVINWKVGDEAHYNVTVASFIKGSMDKSVTKEEGNAVWVKQDINIQIQKQVAEMLIDRATAKVLKFLVDGKEQAIPDDKIEIISQDTQEVTVPAGKFDSIHIVAKSQKVSKIEVWANPKETCMEGTLKQIIATGIMGDMVMELASFKRMP